MYQTPLSHSALFPLLLLSLTGQKHSPECSEKISDEYDYIIGKLIIKIIVIWFLFRLTSTVHNINYKCITLRTFTWLHIFFIKNIVYALLNHLK